MVFTAFFEVLLPRKVLEVRHQVELFSSPTIILASTSPSEIDDYIVIGVYYYATILLYLPLLHRLKLHISVLL